MKFLIVIPAHNEEKIIEKNVILLHDFLQNNFPNDDWKIIVADNSSTDKTKTIVQDLAQKLKKVSYLYIAQRGKGIAIRLAWLGEGADIYIFMDADLATDLRALPSLVNAVSQEGYDLACGSRFQYGSLVKRTAFRKFISLGYRTILRLVFGLKTKDAPCGFKAINQRLKEEVLPLISSNEWFFDSELVILSEVLGYKVKEIPVIWEDKQEEGRKSRVKIIPLILEYLKKVLELKKRIKKMLKEIKK